MDDMMGYGIMPTGKELQRKAYRKVLREYQAYKRKVLCRMSREEAWEECGHIHFFCCAREYFELNERIPEGYLYLVIALNFPIQAMWEMYLQKECLYYQTWDGIEEILEEMLLKWRRPMAG